MAVFAAVDIGANSVRLKIARLRGRALTLIHEDREVTRLGAAVFQSGRLAPAAMDHTVKVLRRFQRAVRHAGSDEARIVATSPLRDAGNAGEFIAWVQAALGWKVEVISGLEEGRLIHLGVLSNARPRARQMLLVDLGGGSCELTLSRGGHIATMHSLPLGAVRLTSEFLKHDPPKSGELRQMREFIREEIGRIAPRLRRAHVPLTVATSGTAASLAAVGGSARIARREVRRLAEKLPRKTAAERAKLRGIGTRRTEIIVAGVTVFHELMEAAQLPSMRYLPLGLLDGLLAQMAAAKQKGGAVGRRIATDRSDAVPALARQYNVDLRFARQVRQLVDTLFTTLRPVHELPEEFRDWVAAAALLHEVGAFINHSGRHRHARYIVAHAEIFGYTPSERLVIANLVRFLGRTQPSSGDRGLQAMPAAEAAQVTRGVVLLRLARALNLGRRGAVRGVRARITENSVELELKCGRLGAPLELWAVAREAAYFRRIFGKTFHATTPTTQK